MTELVLETITKTTDFNTLKKSVLSETPSTDKNKHFVLLSKLLKENRYDLFKTFSSFKIINNGFKAFKCIELENGTRISASIVLNKLGEILG